MEIRVGSAIAYETKAVYPVVTFTALTKVYTVTYSTAGAYTCPLLSSTFPFRGLLLSTSHLNLCQFCD